ncbi:MAG: hypothetical protein ACLRSW_06400 [Christensenellaceae bacterium]
MKLKIKEFEKLAKKRGYCGGKALMEELGAVNMPTPISNAVARSGTIS